MYDKPFLTYDELIDKVEVEYSLFPINREQSRNLFENISYYTLVNGYKDCLMEDNLFIENLTLDDVFLFHHFDVGLQNILFKYGLYAENAFKNKLAYTISKNIGIDTHTYLDSQNYNTKHHSKTVTETIRNLNYVCKNPQSNPTLHYSKNHNHIPPWILFRNARFNDIIKLYVILSSKDKEEVANSVIKESEIEIEIKKELVSKSLQIIRFYRNLIAHRLKIVTSKPKEELPHSIVQFFLPSVLSDEDYAQKIGVSDIYAYILSTVLLIEEDSLRVFFLRELIDHIEIYCGIDRSKRLYVRYLNAADLPLDLSRRIQELYKSILVKYEDY